MHIPQIPIRRLGAGAFTVAAVFALSLNVPIPSMPDPDRARVLDEVNDHLPGWRVRQLHATWEGAYTVVTTCAGRQIGFQFVPGHGLPARDAWLQPNDEYSRDRLRALSDHWRHLVWYNAPALVNTLSCSDEIAGTGRTSMTERRHD
ncbi:MAG: hypothetical protein ABIW50_08560 [Candidatus Limnocylindria bacterium]